MANLQFQTPNSFTEKGSERIRIILEEAKNTLVDEGFSGLSRQFLDLPNRFVFKAFQFPMNLSIWSNQNH
jgi:hypothetical protein